MGKKNLKKIFIGFFLMAVALFLGVSVFYLLKVKPELESRRELKTADVPQTAAQPAIQPSPQPPVAVETKVTQPPVPLSPQERSISLRSLVNKAETVYGEEEKKRREGFMWIDRKSSKFIATLGAINGVFPGNYLTVYDGDNKIGQVKVETAFDVISYVMPLDSAGQYANGDYYRIVKE